ncbi:MAG: hypothetical protein H6765_02185 [Candidatus Peribacteria bacterium]|nr:MAG: hypothetical protein H6765_02185 [Candidatus Peribacteria bacterium]
MYVTDPSAYESSIEVLKAFVEINASQTGANNPFGTGGMTLVIGNDYLSKL